MNQTQLSIMPVGQCNMACPNCTQTPWRGDFAGYQMLPAELRLICSRVKDQGLHFAWAHITGGEPALWEFLKQGCEIIRESGAFDHIEVWSNCKRTKPLMEVLDAGLVDQVITQSANTYKSGSDKLKAKYGDRMNIIPSAGHQVHPDSPLPDALPAECGCDRIAVFNYRVYPCANAYSNAQRMGLDIDNPKIWVSVYDDWRSFVDGMDRYNQEHCRVCLANGRVSRQAPMGKVR